MRYPVPNIRAKLQGLREPRKPLASALVGTDTGHFIVLTLAPLKAVRLMGQGSRVFWETRVHESDPGVRVGLASAPRYASFNTTEAEALARHEALIARLEAGTFETETAQEVLGLVGPFIQQAAERFRAGDHRGAVEALDEGIRVADRVDPVHAFLHLYQEAFLMRAVALERSDPVVAKAAYREFIQLYAELPSHHPDTLRGVARAREAIERLTPTPHGGSARGRVRVDEQIARRSG